VTKKEKVLSYQLQHVPKGEKDQELTTLAVYRRVYIDRDEDRQVAKVMTHGIDTQILRIGSLLFHSVGQILPHQLHNFHNKDYIYPIGYKIVRYYWSLSEVNKRRPYTCSIVEINNKPEFHISTIALDDDGKEVERTFTSETARGAWMQVLTIIEKMRRDNDLVTNVIKKTFFLCRCFCRILSIYQIYSRKIGILMAVKFSRNLF
jgi:histone-lysine N-methyltransferase MLL3